MASAPKLSKTQQELLDAMRGGVELGYMRYMGSWNPTAYYYRNDNFKRVTAAARGLLEKGMVEKFKQESNGDHRLRIKGGA